MEPTTVRERNMFNVGPDNAILEEDGFEKEEDGMSDEDLKIESLKIATNICKLMNNVLPEDIIEVAEKVADFIKNGGPVTLDSNNSTHAEEETEPAAEESDFENDEAGDEVPEETEDFEEDFATDEEGGEEAPAEEEEETEEEFEA